MAKKFVVAMMMHETNTFLAATHADHILRSHR